MAVDILARLLAAARSILSKGHTDKPAGIAPWSSAGDRMLEVPVAGVIHHDDGKPALGLRLREEVSLQREPKNAFDENAIAVLTHRGRRLGYIPRHLARLIAPALETGGAGDKGKVTGLLADPAGRTVGVTIAVSVRRDLDLQMPSPLEFSCEQGDEGGVYVLLNCDSVLLDELQDGLAQRGLACERLGQAFRPASDGNSYQWYIRMAEGVTKENVVAYFGEVHGVAPWRPPSSESVDEYARAFDGEILSREEGIACLQSALDQANEQVRLAKQAQREASAAAMKSLVAGVLPHVEFLRDSWDVLSMEIAEPEGVLRELHAICCSPAEVRAKTVQGAREWKELHFKTGQGDNGRLYFRQSDRRWIALISFKGSQEKDIDYLRKH